MADVKDSLNARTESEANQATATRARGPHQTDSSVLFDNRAAKKLDPVRLPSKLRERVEKAQRRAVAAKDGRHLLLVSPTCFGCWSNEIDLKVSQSSRRAVRWAGRRRRVSSVRGCP
jgi:hypothetical protein